MKTWPNVVLDVHMNLIINCINIYYKKNVDWRTRNGFGVKVAIKKLLNSERYCIWNNINIKQWNKKDRVIISNYKR